MPMAFTAKAMSEANEVPVLHVPLRGRALRYEGKLLSAQEWLVFWDRYVTISERYANLKALADVTPSLAQRTLVALEKESHGFYVEYLKAVFPPSRFKFFVPDPVRLLAEGHPSNLREAFDAFFSLQARAMATSAPMTEPPTNPPTTAPIENSPASTTAAPVRAA